MRDRRRGLQIYRNLNLNTSGISITTTPAYCHGWDMKNMDTLNNVFIKVYDSATTPTSSDVPVMTLGCQKAPNRGSMSILRFRHDPIVFTKGIGIRASNGVADQNNIAPVVNTVIVAVWYSPIP